MTTRDPDQRGVRLFLALDLPPEVAGAVDDAAQPLREVAPQLSWTHTAERHLTVKFLGDVDDSRVDAIAAMMDGVASRHRMFEMQIGGVGAFPNFRRARVVWLGVEHDTRLELLHHDVEVGAETLGFELEGRAFRPHLTLARVRTPMEREQAKALSSAARRVRFTASVPVGEILLYESTLAPSGARYRRLHAAPLGGR